MHFVTFLVHVIDMKHQLKIDLC